MTELFEMILHAPESKKHFITEFSSRYKGKFYMKIYVHKRNEKGEYEEVEDSFDTFFEGDVKTWLKGWIDRITEEAQHDNEGTG